jgi:hypothetical protein
VTGSWRAYHVDHTVSRSKAAHRHPRQTVSHQVRAKRRGTDVARSGVGRAGGFRADQDLVASPVGGSPEVAAEVEDAADIATAKAAMAEPSKDIPVEAVWAGLGRRAAHHHLPARWAKALQAALTAAEQASPLTRRPYDLPHARVSPGSTAASPMTGLGIKDGEDHVRALPRRGIACGDRQYSRSIMNSNYLLMVANWSNGDTL